MDTLISVIIPAYNAEKTIIRCLDSVRNQTYKNIETIVINDGSKDNTLSILGNYAKTYPDISLYIYSINNSGPSYARNYGIIHANGTYIAFLDADDQWVPHKLETQLTCFKKYPHIDMLGCGYSVGRQTISQVKETKCLIISKYQLLLKNSFPTPCVMIRSSVFQTLKFEENQKYSEDYYLWLQIACNNYICALQKEKLTILDDKPTYGQSGLSGNLWKMEKGELKNYMRLFKKKLIPLHWYIISTCFSLIKYIKRILVTLFRKI